MQRDEYSLYILRCADGTLYTGIARDVAERLAAHRGGANGAKYLRGRQPLTLVFERAVGSRSDAQRVEHRVKKLSRSCKLEIVAGLRSLDDLEPDQTSGSCSGNASNGTANCGR